MATRKVVIPLIVCAAVLSWQGAARADCLNKAAVATSGSEKSAKWFALETMVQAVSWGLWPSFVANGTTPGYRITAQSYRCKSQNGAVTCTGQATFCPTRRK
jgi:hypothetical protein